MKKVLFVLGVMCQPVNSGSLLFIWFPTRWSA